MKVGHDPRVDALTEQIIGAAFAVSNDLGHGFLEAVYRNALLEELRHRNLSVAP
jgi:GxxExxY protein